MDAVNFLKEAKRMCDSMTDCIYCPFEYKNGLNESKCSCPVETDQHKFGTDELEDVINTVSAWSTVHPRKSNKEKFIEVFGTLDKDKFMRDEFAWQKWLDEEYKGDD